MFLNVIDGEIEAKWRSLTLHKLCHILLSASTIPIHPVALCNLRGTNLDEDQVMEMQLNFRSLIYMPLVQHRKLVIMRSLSIWAQSYCLILVLSVALLNITGKYIEKLQGKKIVIQRDWHTLMKDQAQSLKSREKYIEVRNQTYKEN